jgi:hypothetical protein
MLIGKMAKNIIMKQFATVIYIKPPFGSSKMIKHFGTDSFQTKELVLNIQ